MRVRATRPRFALHVQQGEGEGLLPRVGGGVRLADALALERASHCRPLRVRERLRLRRGVVRGLDPAEPVLGPAQRVPRPAELLLHARRVPGGAIPLAGRRPLRRGRAGGLVLLADLGHLVLVAAVVLPGHADRPARQAAQHPPRRLARLAVDAHVLVPPAVEQDLAALHGPGPRARLVDEARRAAALVADRPACRPAGAPSGPPCRRRPPAAP